MASTPSIHPAKLIAKKAAKMELTDDEISAYVTGVVSDKVSHEQIGAMLMAIYLNGMTTAETVQLTKSLLYSGETLSFPEFGNLVVDKHSTGGVGDKVSLALAPALAAAGCKVPMISGRGLQHTGGTLDKLEAIPGYNVEQSPESMRKILTDVGCCIVGQTANLVPADRIFYAIRDVTSTVASLPLIVASIISKKAAEGLTALVLDVKVGEAAFMKTVEEARELARAMADVGKGLGVKTSAVLTEMDCPIGMMIGNGLEVVESVHCLQGKGPADLEELVCNEGGALLTSAGLAATLEEGEAMIKATLYDGTALAKFGAMAAAQGVPADVAAKLVQDPWLVLPKASQIDDVLANSSGYVAHIEALPLAEIALEMGAGRKLKTDVLDMAAGVELLVKRGDKVEKGQPWLRLHHNNRVPEEGLRLLDHVLTLSNEPVAIKSRVLESILAL